MIKKYITEISALVCAFIMIGLQHYLGNELRSIDGFYIYALFYLMFKK